ncbi:MAG: hypothetical protein ACYTAN_08430, partial [Planctomycetota bacterium]
IFLWFAVTHRIARFLVPALAVAGAVSGAGLFSVPKGLLRNVLGALTVLLGILCVFYLCAFYGATPDPTVPLLGGYDEFLAETHSACEAWGEVAGIVPPGARVFLHGEAETFYLEFDFAGTTVFDRKFLDEAAEGAASPGEIGARIKEAGFSYVFANWATFRRQQETYRFEYGGVAHEGYSDIATAEFFERMCRADALEVVFSSGGEVYPGAPAHVLYRVK